MTLRESSFLARWAFPFGVPERTNLCALFWRTVLVTPLMLGMSCGSVGLLLAVVIVQLIEDFQSLFKFLIFVVIIVGIVAVLIGIATGCEALDAWLTSLASDARRADEYGAPTDLPDGVRAVFRTKRRLCPMIRVQRKFDA